MNLIVYLKYSKKRLYGSYEALNGGILSESLSDLTGYSFLRKIILIIFKKKLF
jgi:hypothetical protein